MKVDCAAQAMADGTGSHTKMGTWAVDEREAELCELIADQDERWDEAIVGKEQWISKPAQPPGLLRSGMRYAWPRTTPLSSDVLLQSCLGKVSYASKPCTFGRFAACTHIADI